MTINTRHAFDAAFKAIALAVTDGNRAAAHQLGINEGRRERGTVDSSTLRRDGFLFCIIGRKTRKDIDLLVSIRDTVLFAKCSLQPTSFWGFTGVFLYFLKKGKSKSLCDIFLCKITGCIRIK